MATIKLDKQIIAFIRKVSENRKFGDGTMSGVVEDAIMFFSNKHDECFSCQFHKDQISGLELGRQRMAISDYADGKEAEETDGDWIKIEDAMLKRAENIGLHYRRSTKHIVEQAVLEHLTRPPNCIGCPFYAAMLVTMREDKRA